MQNTTYFQSNVPVNIPVADASRANTPWLPRPSRRTLRSLARQWDLVGILSLLATTAAYGVYALAHTGF